MLPIGRYYHTIVHLKPVQIYGRAAFHFSRPKLPPEATPPRRAQSSMITALITKPQNLTGAQEAQFLGHTGAIAAPGDWNNPAQDKLWLYNLHYFDDLNAAEAAGRRVWHGDLIDRWIAENPPTAGNGWEPYPSSLRIVNWIKFALNGVAFPQRWLDSLALQVRWLERRLEWHILGNHLIANAKALVFAGLFFDGPAASRWLALGLAILDSQVREQVLADGGHFELSPMYHSIILEDVLDLINLGKTFPARETTYAIEHWLKTSKQMRRWLAAMTHPDGRIAFFNDAAFGIAPEPAAIEAYAMRLGLPAISAPAEGLLHLSQSGYIRWQGNNAVAFLDVAAIGPDYLPGHAHADSLSFELSVAGERVIVNGGTSTYSKTPQRQRERGTAAHSTVTVDDADSSEIWAKFRVARRARIKELSITDENGVARIAASHDGYLRLGRGAVHRREWMLHGRRLVVRDQVSDTFVNAIARFHLAPGVRASAESPAGAGGAYGALRGDKLAVGWRTSGRATVEPSQWHPAFGRTEETCCIAVRVPRKGADARFDW
jgi:uncharacterized heparinase superfamily protein